MYDYVIMSILYMRKVISLIIGCYRNKSKNTMSYNVYYVNLMEQCAVDHTTGSKLNISKGIEH